MADRKTKSAEITPGEAVNLFERAAKDRPDDANAQLNLGSAYYNVANWEAALRAFQSAARLAPEHAHAHYYLGVIYAKRGDHSKAREAFQKVINGGGHVILKNQARIQLNALDDKQK